MPTGDDPGNGYYYKPEVDGSVGQLNQLTDWDPTDEEFDELEARLKRKKPIGFAPWPEESVGHKRRRRSKK